MAGNDASDGQDAPGNNHTNSETCLERPHVRAAAQDRWSLFTGKMNMICKALAIEIAEFFCHLVKQPRFYCIRSLVIKF